MFNYNYFSDVRCPTLIGTNDLKGFNWHKPTKVCHQTHKFIFLTNVPQLRGGLAFNHYYYCSCAAN